MASQRTENRKRADLYRHLKRECKDCSDSSWCDKHRCAVITRAGARCQNAATYLDERVCGVHLERAADGEGRSWRDEPTTADFDAVRSALAGGKQMQGAQIVRAILGPSSTTDGRRRERKAWLSRWLRLFEAQVILWERGEIVIVRPADGENPDLVALAPSGDA